MTATTEIQYVKPDGRLTYDGLALFQELAAAGGGGGATDLGYTAATRALTSSTGADVTLPLVGANPGLMAAADKTKLDAITGTNTGDQTSIAGITGTKAQFDTAVSDGNFVFVGDALSFALNDATDATVSGAVEGQTLTRDGTDFKNLTRYTFSVGPFFINDMAGTTTTQATLAYFNTATALSRDADDMKMQTAGRIVGLILTSDVPRTAGTATARVRIAGSGAAFNAGSVVLDATNTLSDSDFVAWSSGNAFTAGQLIGAEVTTSGWTPTTANLCIWLVVAMQF